MLMHSILGVELEEVPPKNKIHGGWQVVAKYLTEDSECHNKTTAQFNEMLETLTRLGFTSIFSSDDGKVQRWKSSDDLISVGLAKHDTHVVITELIPVANGH